MTIDPRCSSVLLGSSLWKMVMVMVAADSIICAAVPVCGYRSMVAGSFLSSGHFPTILVTKPW